MAQARSTTFPVFRSPSPSDSSPYNSSHSGSRSSLFLDLDQSDSEYDDDIPESSHSFVSIDSGYFSIMGKESPTNKYSKRKQSKTDLRFPLAPVNTDNTQASPKREGQIRHFLRKKKKSLSTTPSPADSDPFVLAFPLPPLPRENVDIVPQPIFPILSPQSNRDTPAQVFERMDRFALRRGMKHHPYSYDDAPYMQAYDRTLLDNDRFSELLLRRLSVNQSPSFHDCFTCTPPKTILDLGCGPGEWAAEAAEFWPSSHVIGFDLLDPVRLRGGAESPSNVQWKQGNFVKYKLPFPKNMFDLVRIANLSLCIPYERWEHVLSEARRVLAQGGRLELIDDYLYFPYTKRTPIPSGASHDSLPRSKQPSSFDLDDDDKFDDDALSELETDIEDDDFVSTKSRFSTLSVDEIPSPLVYDPIVEWNRNIDNSKSIETLFEEMLSQKFSIHPRPSKFIDSMIDKVFGRYNQSKLHEFNLYLAPPSSKDSDASSVGSSESQGNAGLKKAGKDFAKWMTTVEWDHPKEKEKKPRKSSDRSSGEGTVNLSTVPGTISAKAAGRLGITPPQESAPSPQTHATQSPGLILWPSTFMPIAPLELEMHACKHLHSLIGCKAALMEFIEDIAHQRTLPFDEQLVDNLLWDYESFRRQRFNWPSTCSDFETPVITTPRSTHFRHSSEGQTPTQEHPRVGSFGAMNPPSDPLFSRDKLDFVRSIRVYSATKADEETHVS